jgi:hypothetical protein
MEKDLIVVCTEHVAGREDDYGDAHVPEVAASKGVVSGQRFVPAHPDAYAASRLARQTEQ